MELKHFIRSIMPPNRTHFVSIDAAIDYMENILFDGKVRVEKDYQNGVFKLIGENWIGEYHPDKSITWSEVDDFRPGQDLIL